MHTQPQSACAMSIYMKLYGQVPAFVPLFVLPWDPSGTYHRVLLGVSEFLLAGSGVGLDPAT